MFKNSIYLLGSYFEDFQTQFLILSVGIPVMSFSSPGGHNEILKEDFNGYLCKDNHEFIEKINISLKKKWDRASIIDDIKARYNVEKIINEYTNLLSSY